MKWSFNKKKFRVASKRAAFRGRLVQLDILQIETASGRRYERELIRHQGAAVVIPRLKDGRLILVYQLRVAVGDEIWEFPAGTLEKGESPLAGARRELKEETGWRAKRFRKLAEFYPTPGISTEKMFLYLADGLHQAGELDCDSDEELRASSFSPREIEALLQRGKLIDGKTLLGFLYYQKYAAKRRHS